VGVHAEEAAFTFFEINWWAAAPFQEPFFEVVEHFVVFFMSIALTILTK